MVGAGMQGRVAAWDLSKAGHDIVVLDFNLESLRKIKKSANIKTHTFNVKKRARFIKFMKNFDIIVGALPSAFGFYTMECALKAGVDLVDMSYAPEDPFLLDKDAKKKKIRIVPDAGFAPGLSNILVGEVYKYFGGIDNLRILVGGIPQKPQPPFNYHITWSPADLIEEYTRPARIIKNHKTITVKALSSIEVFTIPKLGRFECFYSDGLRTFIKTIKNVTNMEEKTIRYPGHAKIFETIIDCGFLSEVPFAIGKKLYKPKNFTLEFLKNVLTRGDKKDLSILIIEIEKNRQKKRLTCIDYYDEKNKISSMARMTAYTGSIITQCIKRYQGFGVIPPEYLGMDKNLCKFIKDELKKRRIIIKEPT